jgi:hypothetical protein
MPALGACPIRGIGYSRILALQACKLLILRNRKALLHHGDTLLDVALHAGLRLGDSYGPRWENANPSHRILAVPRSKNGETQHVPL